MRENWKVSLHGGHSGQFCDHAKGSLREIVEAAIASGMTTFGLTEHSPRFRDQDIFQEEKDKGWNAETLEEIFLSYSKEVDFLREEYSDQIRLLKGFETEAVPDESYAEKMLSYKKDLMFDYIVGSVHHVNDICIDAYSGWTEQAMKSLGGLDQLATEYYRSLTKMVDNLRPEVVGHFDLIKKFAEDFGPLDTPIIREEVRKALKVIKHHGSILDLNVYPIREGKRYPYPSPWIVEMARNLDLAFCFGDDSHSPDTVGAGIEEGREYLLSFGIDTITSLKKENGELKKVEISLK